VYAEIGRQLEREGLNSVDHRTVVSKPRKLYLIARATAVAVNAPAVGALAMTAEPAIAFLVQSVVDAQGRMPRRQAWRIPQRNFEERVEWMVNLLGRLEERERPTP
jgi:phytoene synthase